jgi:hypothetical protein
MRTRVLRHLRQGERGTNVKKIESALYMNKKFKKQCGGA